MSDMWVVVYCNEGADSGHVYLCRELGDDELLNEQTFANEIASQHDRSLAETSAYIPNCCGDLRVEFMDHKPRISGGRFQGATRIWSGKSFYYAECDS